jgi:hypothetical protein
VRDLVDVDSTKNIVTISTSSKSSDQGRRYAYIVRASKTGVECTSWERVSHTRTVSDLKIE